MTVRHRLLFDFIASSHLTRLILYSLQVKPIPAMKMLSNFFQSISQQISHFPEYQQNITLGLFIIYINSWRVMISTWNITPCSIDISWEDGVSSMGENALLGVFSIRSTAERLESIRCTVIKQFTAELLLQEKGQLVFPSIPILHQRQ